MNGQGDLAGEALRADVVSLDQKDNSRVPSLIYASSKGLRETYTLREAIQDGKNIGVTGRSFKVYKSSEGAAFKARNNRDEE